MKNAIYLILMVSLFLASCKKDDDNVDVDVHADLYGTWVMDRVAISGFGFIEGISKVSFDQDGGYRSDISFTATSTGCDYTLFYVGTFSGDATTITTQMDRGEVEITGCTNTDDISTRDYTSDELDAAGITLEWKIVGNTLELITNEDNLNRIYERL